MSGSIVSWTPQMDAVIRSMAGSSWAKIGLALHVNDSAVARRAMRLGVKGKRTLTKFSTDSIDASILSMSKEGRTYKEMSNVMGISRRSINARALELGLSQQGQRASWTPERDAAVFKLRAEGKTWGEIGKTWGMHGSSVAARAKVLGVLYTKITGARPTKNPTPPGMKPGNRIVWTADQDNTILTMRWQRKSWDDIADVIGYAVNTVYARGVRIKALCAPVKQPDPVPEDRGATLGGGPLPAFHPISMVGINTVPAWWTE